ncbi:hypothetical protein GCM10009547_45240 [Sporichthya brevicatena]|uniref:Uncharacterized protein n=1 Tax=Sporichthya brevicatena TaxID=171442 RepID=A0ABP3SGG2_9ACTN
MSPYERQIDPLESVDLTLVMGVPGQATPSRDETLERLIGAPPSAQRLLAPAPAAPTPVGPSRLRLSLGVAGAAVLAVAGLLAAVSLAGDSGAPTRAAKANGAATAHVLARDLGVSLGTYAAGGLPVTLTNTSERTLAYNVTVEALDEAGRRVTLDAVFTTALTPGQATSVRLFANHTGATADALAASTFRVVEASAY